MNNIKVYLDERLKEVKISKELTNQILEQAPEKSSNQKKYYSIQKFVTIAVTICIFFTLSVTAMAATNSYFNNFIYSLNPSFAKLLYPIHKTAEDNGIKVEVLYAVNDSHTAKVFFTIQDVLGENRVNEMLDLCDSYHINGPTAFGIEFISYDKDTQTALYMMEGLGGEGLSGKMAGFKIDTLMSNKKEFEWYNTGINLSANISENAKAVPLSDYAYTGGSEEFEQILEPDQMNLSLGENIDFVTISNVGFIDGKLHIQTKWETSFDNHGELWLTDKNGVVNEEANQIEHSLNYFRTSEDEEKCGNNLFTKHIEYVYDIANVEELSQYELWGRFVKDGTFTKGKWEVNFRLENAEGITVMNPAGAAKSLEITSLGIYVTQYENSKEDCTIQLNLKDGTAMSFMNLQFAEALDAESSKWNLSTSMNAPFEVENIKEVYLDGVFVYGNP